MLKKSKTKKGFTLVEVILSMAILVIMTTSIFFALNSANGITIKSNNFNDAAFSATSQFANGYTTSTTNKQIAINDTPATASDQTINYDDRLMTATTYNEGIYESVGTYNGTTVKYFYYVPYHPYRCGTDCKQCNRENFEAPAAG
jgi:prepilin-type N-terminal cleavage/methylation domain-containing protein